MYRPVVLSACLLMLLASFFALPAAQAQESVREIWLLSGTRGTCEIMLGTDEIGQYGEKAVIHLDPDCAYRALAAYNTANGGRTIHFFRFRGRSLMDAARLNRPGRGRFAPFGGTINGEPATLRRDQADDDRQPRPQPDAEIDQGFDIDDHRGVTPNPPPIGDACALRYVDTNGCAPESEIQARWVGNGWETITTRRGLYLRARAQENAPIVATVPQDTCVRTLRCQPSGATTWCEVQFATFRGWLVKRRNDQVMASNGCG